MLLTDRKSVPVLIKSLVTHGWNICATEAVEISFKFINIGTKWDGQTNEQKLNLYRSFILLQSAVQWVIKQKYE